jgi:hypothetical protein
MGWIFKEREKKKKKNWTCVHSLLTVKSSMLLSVSKNDINRMYP